MKSSLKKIFSVMMALYILFSISIIAFAVNTTSESSNANPIEYKYNFVLKYGNYTFDENKAYSWNSADETLISENNADITPYWNSGTVGKSYGMHGILIDDCNEFTVKPIPDKYVNLVKRTNQKCDQYYSAYTAFHAGGNYIATLKYLWDFINEIDELTEINTTVINTIGNNCYNSLPETVKTSSKDELNEITKKLVRNNYDIPSGITNHTELERAKYVLYGIMYHFLGDLYAHRLIVPIDSIKPFINEFGATSDSYNSKRMFDPDDFEDSLEAELISKVENQNLQFNKIRNYYVENPSKNYADSPTFYPYRVDEALMTMAFFTDCVDDGFNYEALPPVYNFKLYNYDNYLIRMGIV